LLPAHHWRRGRRGGADCWDPCQRHRTLSEPSVSPTQLSAAGGGYSLMRCDLAARSQIRPPPSARMGAALEGWQAVLSAEDEATRKVRDALECLRPRAHDQEQVGAPARRAMHIRNRLAAARTATGHCFDSTGDYGARDGW
jgi:hypothetical protein